MILVTGGTGSVGLQVTAALRRQGRPVRILARSAAKAARLAGRLDADLHVGSFHDPLALDTALAGVEAVIHLVGILVETPRHTYHQAHVDATARLIEACRRHGVTRFLHMSAAGTREHAPSRYHQTKWQAETLVRQSGFDWTIFRPSLIYGPGDHFLTLLGPLWRHPLFTMTGGLFPLPGAQTLMQPVPIQLVAEAFAGAVPNRAAFAKTYELASPPLPLIDMMRAAAAALGCHPRFVPVPLGLAHTAAWLAEHALPWGPRFTEPLWMASENQNADASPVLRDLGLRIPPFAEGLRQALAAT
jgi:uncharacterized protein YbjT (DUF2867 family)